MVSIFVSSNFASIKQFYCYMYILLLFYYLIINYDYNIDFFRYYAQYRLYFITTILLLLF